MRKVKRRSPERSAEEIFRRRAIRFQSRCGWCGRQVGDEPVVGIGGRAWPELDLSAVQGKVIEIIMEKAGKTVLGCVTGEDSEARKAGNDLMFMACSEECGGDLQVALKAELASRLM